MVPVSGVRNPHMRESKVVLPAPLLPTIPKVVAESISRRDYTQGEVFVHSFRNTIQFQVHFNVPILLIAIVYIISYK